jgi:CubicO group peptidase (beta-lactamase class C family)
MKHPRASIWALPLALVLSAWVASQGLPEADPATIGLDPAVLARIDSAMPGFIENQDVAGIVALIGRHGKVGYFRTFGYRDVDTKEPMRKDAIFRLQSMTKPVTAVAAMILYDEGKLRLDEPIHRLLPEWRDVKVAETVTDPGSGAKTVRLVPASSPITPRHLMTHSSGLYYAGSGPEGVDPRSLPSASPLSTTITLEEWSRQWARAPLKFHPGTGYQYGHSLDLLGRYIEVVSGQRFDAFLRERIFKPLRMVDTGFSVPEAARNRVAQLYTQPAPGTLRLGRPIETVLRQPSLLLGGQGLLSTAGDYARFSQMLLNQGTLDGVRVLRPETVALMFQNHLPSDVGRLYGLGGVVDGKGSYSWGGANGTQFWVNAATGMFSVWMVQTQGYRTQAYPAYNRLARTAGEGVDPSASDINPQGLGQPGRLGR